MAEECTATPAQLLSASRVLAARIQGDMGCEKLSIMCIKCINAMVNANDDLRDGRVPDDDDGTRRREWFYATPARFRTSRVIARWCGCAAIEAYEHCNTMSDEDTVEWVQWVVETASRYCSQHRHRSSKIRPATRKALYLIHQNNGQVEVMRGDGPRINEFLVSCRDRFDLSCHTVHETRSLLFAMRKAECVEGSDRFRSHLCEIPASFMAKNEGLWRLPLRLVRVLARSTIDVDEVVTLVDLMTMNPHRHPNDSTIETRTQTVCIRLTEILHSATNRHVSPLFPARDTSTFESLVEYAVLVCKETDWGTVDACNRTIHQVVIPFLVRATQCSYFTNIEHAPTDERIHFLVARYTAQFYTTARGGAEDTGTSRKRKRDTAIPRCNKMEIDEGFIQRMLDHCVNSEERCFVILSSTTGLRSRALSMIRIEDIVSPETPTRVRTCFDVREKGDTRRRIWPTKEATEAIELFLRDLRNPEAGYLFENQRCKNKPSRYFASNCMRRITKRINAPIGHHAFRRYIVKRCVDMGSDIHIVSKWLGHKSTNTTFTHYLSRSPGPVALNASMDAENMDVLCKAFGFAKPIVATTAKK